LFKEFSGLNDPHFDQNNHEMRIIDPNISERNGEIKKKVVDATKPNRIKKKSRHPPPQ
jgi:hypothetical protein